MFIDLFKNMTKMFSDDKSKNGSESSQQDTKNTEEAGFVKKLTAATWFTMKYMVGAYPNGDPSFLKDLGKISGTEFTSYDSKIFTGSSVGDYVMKFPYALYYRL